MASQEDCDRSYECRYDGKDCSTYDFEGFQVEFDSNSGQIIINKGLDSDE